MNVLIIANCYFPDGFTVQDMENILRYLGKVGKLVILGDFLDFPRRVTDDFILKLEKPLHKLLNKVVNYGCEEIVYVIGDRDRVLLDFNIKTLQRLFSTRYHLVKVCPYHVMNIGGAHVVLSHGHNQLNIAITEELSPEKTDEQILIDAARRARRKEEVAGLRGTLPRGSWWFVGHTTLLYVDEHYRIVHVGYLSKYHKISGGGPYTSSMYVPETNRGFVVVDSNTRELRLVQYPSMKVVKRVILS